LSANGKERVAKLEPNQPAFPAIVLNRPYLADGQSEHRTRRRIEWCRATATFKPEGRMRKCVSWLDCGVPSAFFLYALRA